MLLTKWTKLITGGVFFVDAVQIIYCITKLLKNEFSVALTPLEWIIHWNCVFWLWQGIGRQNHDWLACVWYAWNTFYICCVLHADLVLCREKGILQSAIGNYKQEHNKWSSCDHVCVCTEMAATSQVYVLFAKTWYLCKDTKDTGVCSILSICLKKLLIQDGMNCIT